jgi:hypothetical protein
MSLAGEIKLTIIERGERSKSDIQRLWGPSDEHYRALQDELDRVKVLRAGLICTAGYEVAYAKRPGEPEKSLPGPTFVHDWQNQGLARFVELFSHADLERRSRQNMTGEDRLGSTKEPLALVIQHGVDLFRDDGCSSVGMQRSSARYQPRPKNQNRAATWHQKTRS